MGTSTSSNEYFSDLPADGLSDKQASAAAAIRAVLAELRPAAVDPKQTTARLEPHPIDHDPDTPVLRLHIPHRADPDVWIQIRVEPWGTLWFSSDPLGVDFGVSFDNEYEPWESAGDLAAAQELLRELLEGRWEARKRFFGKRLIRTRFVRTDKDGRRQGRGVYYHVPNLPYALIPGVRTKVYRPSYLDPHSTGDTP